jgi:hypothetical protein
LPTEIALTNTEIARLLTETAIANTSPEAVETSTPTPTTTVTPTEVVVLATSTSTATALPTEDPLVATAQAQATLNAAQQAPTATLTSTPTELPTTGGFAEDIGIPGMLMLAAVLVTVIFVARHLRSRAT